MWPRIRTSDGSLLCLVAGIYGVCAALIGRPERRERHVESVCAEYLLFEIDRTFLLELDPLEMEQLGGVASALRAARNGLQRTGRKANLPNKPWEIVLETKAALCLERPLRGVELLAVDRDARARVVGVRELRPKGPHHDVPRKRIYISDPKRNRH